ncbi:MAG: response regulator, partial [Planctomycetes bacterium]|nr:response regulator [Planctomycetota bacterium]
LTNYREEAQGTSTAHTRRIEARLERVYDLARTLSGQPSVRRLASPGATPDAATIESIDDAGRELADLLPGVEVGLLRVGETSEPRRLGPFPSSTPATVSLWSDAIPTAAASIAWPAAPPEKAERRPRTLTRVLAGGRDRFIAHFTPLLDLAGECRGSIVVLLPIDTVLSLLPSSEYTLRNSSLSLSISPPGPGARSSTPLFSCSLPLNWTRDDSDWRLEVAFDDQRFEERTEVADARATERIGWALILLIAALLGWVITLVRRQRSATQSFVSQLERAVDERTVELVRRGRELERENRERRRVEVELLEAKQTSDDANRAKSEFLACMSHEIRTPLNGVIGMTDLLLTTRLADRQRRFASVAKASASALLELIDDILDFSKIEAGEMKLERTEVDVSSLVLEAVEVFAPGAARKGLDLVVDDVLDHPVVVETDPERLGQVLRNLIGNATKFTDAGSVVVRLRVDGDRCRIEVDDTGCGIAPEKQETIFDAFQQASSSTSRKFGGTGLGLAISRRLIEMLGGQLRVSSSEGAGSTFWVELGGVRAAVDPPPPPAIDGHALVIDAPTPQRDVLVATLRRWGMRVTEVDDAKVLDAVSVDTVTTIIADPRAVSDDDRDRWTAGKARWIELRGLADTRSDIENDERTGPPAIALTKPIRPADLLEVLSSPPVEQRVSERDVEPSTTLSPTSPDAAPRVLVVEDNEINRLVVSELLEELGHGCDLAFDGEQAIARVLERHYRVVLMDCNMPVLNGFDATRRIRELEEQGALGDRPHTVIIALTANAIVGDRERCLEAGMDGYLTKPIDLDALTRTLEEHCGPSVSQAERA